MKMKLKYANTSNERLNVPMTGEEWDVVSFIAFKSETSVIYPFTVEFDKLNMDVISKIVEKCNGKTYDTEMLYTVCEDILGVNEELIKR